MTTRSYEFQTLVHQFADPHAFLRELVQNAIDAGSRQIEFDFDLKQTSGEWSIAIQDYGIGMDRHTIETRLTRLFSSAKDGDRTKIGRFGIGFVSVFAMDPYRVVVDTARSGEAWRLEISPDLTYKLFESEEALEGTRVTLYGIASRPKREQLVKQLKTALSKWCQFVEPKVRWNGRLINKEFLALSSCQSTRYVDGARIVAGYQADSQCNLAFYNRGLLVWEAPSPFPHVGARVDSPQLEHTLSRDSVLQDEHYHALWKELNELIVGPLREQLFAKLEESAAASSTKSNETGGSAGGADLATAALERAATRLFKLAATASQPGPLPAAILSRKLVKQAHSTHLPTLADLLEYKRRGLLHYSPAETPLSQQVAEGDNVVVIAAAPSTQRMLEALPGPGPVISDVNALFHTALPLPLEHALTQAAERLLAELTRLVNCPLHLGTLNYTGSSLTQHVALVQKRPFELRRGGILEQPGPGSCLIINATHPQVSRVIELSVHEPELAALALVLWLPPSVSGGHRRKPSQAQSLLTRRDERRRTSLT